jgi:hypothetical protein
MCKTRKILGRPACPCPSIIYDYYYEIPRVYHLRARDARRFTGSLQTSLIDSLQVLQRSRDNVGRLTLGYLPLGLSGNNIGFLGQPTTSEKKIPPLIPDSGFPLLRLRIPSCFLSSCFCLRPCLRPHPRPRLPPSSTCRANAINQSPFQLYYPTLTPPLRHWQPHAQTETASDPDQTQTSICGVYVGIH